MDERAQMAIDPKVQDGDINGRKSLSAAFPPLEAL